jgi:hypothetical protein
MLFALRLAASRKLAAPAARRLSTVLRAMSLPPLPAIDADELLTFLARDKKAREGDDAAAPKIGWVLPQDVGRGRWGQRVPIDEVRRELVLFLAEEAP